MDEKIDCDYLNMIKSQKSKEISYFRHNFSGRMFLNVILGATIDFLKKLKILEKWIEKIRSRDYKFNLTKSLIALINNK
ncbi:MAG: hypothetical protein ACTSVI_01750 [Promethearchaeota archaeon]